MSNARDVFANNLKLALDRRGISQTDLSDSVGVSTATVSYWVSGRKYPRPDKMQTIADLLGVTMSWLTTGDADGFVAFDDAHIFAEKYAALDAHGRAVIDAIMSLEEKRIEEQKHEEKD